MRKKLAIPLMITIFFSQQLAADATMNLTIDNSTRQRVSTHANASNVTTVRQESSVWMQYAPLVAAACLVYYVYRSARYPVQKIRKRLLG